MISLLLYIKASSDLYYILHQQACEVCHSNDNGEEMLLCDGCDCGICIYYFYE